MTVWKPCFRRAFAAAIIPLALGGGVNAQVPKWTATRDLRIGDIDDPELALTWMRGIALAGDGSFFSLHVTEKLVRSFDAQGKLQKKFGRGGDGPGEFDNPAGIAWRGDSLYVWDSVDQRFNLFKTDGTFITAVTVRPVNPTPQSTRIFPTALLGDGGVLASVGMSDPRIPARRSTLVRLTRAGEVTDTVAFFGPTSNLLFNNLPRFMITSVNPLGASTLTVLSADGNALYLIDRPAAERNGPSSFTVQRVNLRGDTTVTRPIAYTPQRIAKQLADSLTESYVKMLSEVVEGRPARLGRSDAEKLVRTVFVPPAFHPPVKSAIAGQDGTLWIQREDLGAATIGWLILDAEARTIATVDLPRKTGIFTATRSVVLGTEYDDLQVPYIVRYRLTQVPVRTR